MENYHSVTTSTSRHEFLNSMKLKYSRQRTNNHQFTARMPLTQDSQNKNIEERYRTHEELSLRKRDNEVYGRNQGSHFYSKPLLASRDHVEATIHNTTSIPYPPEPVFDTAGLKKIVSLKIKDHKPLKLSIKEKPFKYQQKQDFDSIFKQLDSPIKLINNSNSPQKIKIPNSTRLLFEGTKEILKPQKIDKQNMLKVDRQSTNKTITSIDTILATIKQALTKN